MKETEDAIEKRNRRCDRGSRRSSREKVNPSLRAIFCILPYLADLNGSAWLVLRCAKGVVFRRVLSISGLLRLSFFPASHKFRSFMCLSVAFAESSKCIATYLDDKTFDDRDILDIPFNFLRIYMSIVL